MSRIDKIIGTIDEGLNGEVFQVQSAANVANDYMVENAERNQRKFIKQIGYPALSSLGDVRRDILHRAEEAAGYPFPSQLPSNDPFDTLFFEAEPARLSRQRLVWIRSLAIQKMSLLSYKGLMALSRSNRREVNEVQPSAEGLSNEQLLARAMERAVYE